MKKVWISKNMQGNVEIWEYKPYLNQNNGLFYESGKNGDAFWFGRTKTPNVSLKRGETKRIALRFEEIFTSANNI